MYICLLWNRWQNGSHTIFDSIHVRKTCTFESFLVAGKSVNTTPLIVALISDRTGSTRSHLPWRCFPEPMDHGHTWKWSLQKFPSVLISAHLWDCAAQIFRLLKSSRTMLWAVSLLMPNSSTINLSVNRRSCASIYRISSIISGVLLVDGRPECGPSSVVSFFSRKRLNHS